MSTICLIGGRSLLGRHLLTLLYSTRSPLDELPREVRVWTEEEIGAEIDHADFASSVLRFFSGMEELEQAVTGAEIVINCHECVDWSMLPDESKLRAANVELPRALVTAMDESARLVHVSSALVQCSARWPNISGKEQRAERHEGGWPFPAYCQSRVDGEAVMEAREGPTVIVRVPILYGEGDEKSPVTDLIKVSSLFSSVIPYVGDDGGCMQFAYASNVAAGVLRATATTACRSLSEGRPRDRHDRLVIVTDETPVRNTYETLLPMVQNGKVRRSSFSLPFMLIFLPFLLFSLLVRALDKVVQLPGAIRKLPSPWMLYFFVYHWTCFSSFKAALLLGHKDIYSQEEVQSRAASYYRKLDPACIEQFSWES